MAGSFDVFRRNQRAALAALAILAMIAFFVLPPFLQMGGSMGSRDAVVASWTGGEMRQSDMERSAAMGAVVNRFLSMAAEAASGRPVGRVNFAAEDERSVVRQALLAKEAAANGVVVSDAAINDFLGQVTNNLVRQEQFDQIIGQLRLGPMAVSQHDLFEGLRAALAARSMQMMFQSGFSGDPPGWRWDYFRRLEQTATAELVAVPAESLAADVPAPSEATLREFFEQYKDDLPEARSADPGFKEPHRVKYEYLVVKREAVEADSAKAVTDEQIADFYEKNKTALFRAKPDAGDGTAEAKKAEGGPSQDKAPGDGQKPDGEAKDKDEPAKPAAGDAAPKGSAVSRGKFLPVAFRQPAAATKDVPEPQKPAAAAEKQAAGGEAADDKAAAAGKASQDEEASFEPLEKVKDDIRKRLAREEADKRVDKLFGFVASDITAYAESVALWQARGKDAGAAAPEPPDLDKIVAQQALPGLEAGRSELMAADEAVASGPIGGSFDFVVDSSSRFGVRQQRWLDSMFGESAPTLRPITSRDVEGNRYMSWKTEDQPEFSPTFQAARANVERAWRIVEARSLARKKAQEIAAAADSSQQTLAAVAAGKPGLEAATVGPFTWLTQGNVSLEAAPMLSQPEGVSMPGEDFMQAVFGLEPGKTAVAFNEPRTVCYAIRLVSFEPATEKLRERFVEGRDDQRRLALVAQRETNAAIGDWIENLESRHGLKWNRQPR